MQVYQNVIEMIGHTPLLALNHLDTGRCGLYVKLENLNPGGSIKDRMALSMIRDAEEKGQINPGDLIVEATAGNTGIGLAQVALAKGYRLVLVLPDKMSAEKIAALRAFGTEVITTRSDVGVGHPEYYQDLAQKIAEERGGFYINQFANPANPAAHESTTAPEIWEQLDHRVDAVVVAVGSGGTLTGIGRFFSKVSPSTEIVLADPVGSILADLTAGKPLKEAGSWYVEGIGEDFVPTTCDLSFVSKAYEVSDQESFDAVRMLLRKEGILAGSSTGTLLSAALRYCHDQESPKRVVTFVCDTGDRYLSKMFNAEWMKEHGFSDPDEETK